MSSSAFNIDGGYLEGLCRGFKCGILKQSDYLNLVQCETLEGRYKKHIFFIMISFINVYALSETLLNASFQWASKFPS